MNSFPLYEQFVAKIKEVDVRPQPSSSSGYTYDTEYTGFKNLWYKKEPAKPSTKPATVPKN